MDQPLEMRGTNKRDVDAGLKESALKFVLSFAETENKLGNIPK
jgi:hypothetical protein